MMKLRALGVTIHVGDEAFGPGEVFSFRDRNEGRSLIERGFAELVEPEATQLRDDPISRPVQTSAKPVESIPASLEPALPAAKDAALALFSGSSGEPEAQESAEPDRAAS